MRPTVSAVFALLLALTRAAPGPEECHQLRTHTDRNEVVGRFYLEAGFADHDLFKHLLGLSSSLWGEMSLTEGGLKVDEYGKMGGVCVEFRTNVAMEGDTAKASMAGVSSEFKLHQLTSTLMVMDGHATVNNFTEVLRSLHLDPSLAHGQDSFTVHCYYLLSRAQEVTDAEMQLFKNQAKCAGFTGEPSFVHHSDQGYCHELDSFLYNPDPECSKLVRMGTMTDKNEVAGTEYFMAAFTDSDVLNSLLGLSTSLWVEINPNEDGYNVREYSRMNGTCVELNFNVTQSGSLLKMSQFGVESEFKVRKFTHNSRVMDVRVSADNLLPMLQQLHLDTTVTHGQSSLKGRGYYLLSDSPEVNEAEVQLFRKYAHCAGFPEEPALLNKGNNDYCGKDGNVLVN